MAGTSEQHSAALFRGGQVRRGFLWRADDDGVRVRYPEGIIELLVDIE
jgi:hypothetical protein